jgi:hypothetical protein
MQYWVRGQPDEFKEGAYYEAYPPLGREILLGVCRFERDEVYNTLVWLFRRYGGVIRSYIYMDRVISLKFREIPVTDLPLYFHLHITPEGEKELKNAATLRSCSTGP